ncbi:MAG TPA: hypothetical protein VE152_06655, partial [Acidimicrobiales bacterium]|nr:hypothetical protein [Acidimicrobiales bacterium]
MAEGTRCTTRPREERYTATRSQAGPVGATTTSRAVPSSAPARAASSTWARLSRGGQHLALATTSPASSSTLTVWALAIPR